MRGGGGIMVAGLVMMALGVALTALSFVAAGVTGGTFLIFPGLIISGLVMFFRGAATPTARGYSSGRGHNPLRRSYETRARPARSLPEDYVAPPGMMPAGYCWACGRKVRKGNTICYACGAAQVIAPPRHRRQPSSPSQPPQPPYSDGPYPGGPYQSGLYPGDPYPNGPYSGGPYSDSSYSDAPGW